MTLMKRRMALVVLAEVSALFFAGPIFGWAPLLLMYKEKGFYASSCGDGPTWCVAQKNSLTFVYTIGVVTTEGCAVLVGLAIDWVGPRWVVLGASILEALGLYLLLCFDSPIMLPGVTIECLVAGSALMAVGSQGFFAHALSAGGVLPSHRILIISLACTLFDASSVVFVVCKIVYDHLGVDLYLVGLLLMVLSVLMGGAMTALRASIEAEEKLELEEQTQPEEKDDECFQSYQDICHEEEAIQSHCALRDMKGAKDSHCELSETSHSSASSLSSTCDDSLLATRAFMRKLFSLEFSFVLVYMWVHMTRSNLYLGELEPFFESIGGQDIDTYVQTATFLVPLGVIYTKPVEIIISHLGGNAAWVVLLLGAIYSFLNFVDSLWVQLIATAVYGFYRALLFSFGSAFVLEVFKSFTFNGLMYSSAGLVSLIITPSIKWAETDGSFTLLNGIMLAIMAPALILSVVLYLFSEEPYVHGRKSRGNGFEEACVHVIPRNSSWDSLEYLESNAKKREMRIEMKRLKRAAGGERGSETVPFGMGTQGVTRYDGVADSGEQSGELPHCWV